MVAPTRAPEARGMKCDLCKKILALATWIDQTKLAKKVEEAQTVLDMIKKHDATDCPCIPNSIQNLLVGSTHFELHRLITKNLDTHVNKLQRDFILETRSQKQPNQNVNDCNEIGENSRFKLPPGHSDSKSQEKVSQALKHLILSTDFWRTAMDDQANSFNSKLALRLGLTHHVIYACYLFKYYRILDYQLISANLLLNLFRTIEGVTANAVIHASYLLIRSLIDCRQLSSARSHLKEAIKATNYSDKTYYESILLTCASCELNLLENEDCYNALDELAQLSVIKPEDKLQHYYARALAISIVIKYIHLYPARSDNCYEFYHAFRYTCAIMRRCYESTFELILSEKDVKSQSKTNGIVTGQIMDHSWIRFAVCDFVYSAFDSLSKFYIRAGLPENLEVIYNTLNLISFKTGSHYWQARMLAIGANLDILCDKYAHAQSKLDIMSRIISHSANVYLMNLSRLDLEVNSLILHYSRGNTIQKDTVSEILQRIKDCHISLIHRITKIDLYDCRLGTHSRASSNLKYDQNLIVFGDIVGRLSLQAIKVLVLSLVHSGDAQGAKSIISQLGFQLANQDYQILEYNENHLLLEILIHSIDIDKTQNFLLEAINSNGRFLTAEDGLSVIDSRLSALTISARSISTLSADNNEEKKGGRGRRKPRGAGVSSLSRRSKRKMTYNVANVESSLNDHNATRFFDTVEAIKNILSLTDEEVAICYLRNSEPNPDYLLYKQAHERMFIHRLRDSSSNSTQLLYHFCESSTANTMRYRWMMFDEQQFGLAGHQSGSKHLGFNGHLINCEKTVKSFARHIQDDVSLVQIKFVVDNLTKKEHLLIAYFDADLDPIFVHVSKQVSSDDFLKDAGDILAEENSLPGRFLSKVEEAKRTLFYNNHRSRTEARQRIEREMDLLLYDFEKELLGSFKFLMCGKICDTSYCKFVRFLNEEINHLMEGYTCQSPCALKIMLENAPLLSREEFCQALSSVFNCSATQDEIRNCYERWLEMIEDPERGPLKGESVNKTNYLQSLSRGQVGLILDKQLELFPFESLRISRIARPAMFRVPSLRLFSAIASRYCQPVKLDSNDTAFILDPAGNLCKTRERFENRLRSQKTWIGTIGHPPKEDLLEQWLSKKQVYLFIGHGAGTTYYNKLCRGRGLSAMSSVKPVAILMGCSSGRVSSEGPKLESFGISWVFIFRGAPSFVGLLWDVTDTDIDRFLGSLLFRWMNISAWNEPAQASDIFHHSTDHLRNIEDSHSISITNSVALSRPVCQYKFLVGAAPVVYGLPVWCQSNQT